MFIFPMFTSEDWCREHISAWRLLDQSKAKRQMADTEKSVKIEEGDPQSVQDLTGFVPFHIQHLQS